MNGGEEGEALPFVSDAEWRAAARDLHALFKAAAPTAAAATAAASAAAAATSTIGAAGVSTRPTLQALRSLHKSLRLFARCEDEERPDSSEPTTVNWMTLFSEAMSLEDEDERDEAVCAVELAFRKTALRVARKIVGELHLPNEKKSVKRSGIGGFAGKVFFFFFFPLPRMPLLCYIF